LEQLREESENFQDLKKEKLDGIAKRLIDLDSKICDDGQLSARLSEIRARREELNGLSSGYRDAQRSLAQAEANLSALQRDQRKYSAPGPAVCPVCLGPAANENKANHIKELDNQISDALGRVKSASAEVLKFEKLLKILPELEKEQNSVQAQRDQNSRLIRQFTAVQEEYKREEALENKAAAELARRADEANPHMSLVETTEYQVNSADEDAVMAKTKVDHAEIRLSIYSQLYDIAMEFRGRLLETSVRQLERNTNAALSKYFDGEIKVGFSLSSDRLDVEIQKNGYSCSFKALSGGQRCMLKLALSISLMAASSDKAGVHFDCLFLDEPMNGMDTVAKLKAFNLLEKLSAEHASVIVIDHCEEFKSLFSNRYEVSLSGESSSIVHLESGDAK
jgi:DNA repair exonuclease SbcCD ATPase subunit